ncbi:unnamed protein product [Cunninghamella blakesleeana]
MFSLHFRNTTKNIGRYQRINNYSTKTFSNQKAIPSLPIPDLEATGQRYKKSLIPLITNKAEYERVRFGKELQARLKALDEIETKRGYSWLDQLWLNKAYLEYRAPTLINVNLWMQFRNHPNKGIVDPSTKDTATPFQLERAAGLISGLLDYNHCLNNEEIPPDVSRSGPFCMHQLKGVFSTTRIPDLPRDRVISHYPATAKHITVIYKDQLFSVDVIGPNGETLSTKAIENQLKQVVDEINSKPSDQHQLPIGVLTSEHRDTWAKIRKSLESDSQNAAIITVHSNLDVAHCNICHGNAAHNRWFDKNVQVIVETNGAAGVNGEHSPIDAVVPLRIIDDVLLREPINVEGSTKIAPPRHLKWNLSNEEQMKSTVLEATENAKNLINDLDCVLLQYKDYGSNFMKNSKVSPDSWVQMAFQLAYYRHYGHPCPTYESASTRKFLTGRTETVRSCSEESVAFTKAWDDKNVSIKDKLSYLERALKSHGEYMKAASSGQGVDRHLFGLYFQLTPEEAKSDLAAIFKDPSYGQSQYWKLSTSNTSPGNLAWGAFGPVVTDGYGINYAIDKEMVRLSVSSWKSAKDTDSNDFRKTIKTVFDDFGDVAQRYLQNQA